jgi:hypothetical protein
MSAIEFDDALTEATWILQSRLVSGRPVNLEECLAEAISVYLDRKANDAIIILPTKGKQNDRNSGAH